MWNAMETERKCAGCTLAVNPLLFVTAIVASNPGDLVRGALVLITPARPAISIFRNSAQCLNGATECSNYIIATLYSKRKKSI